ncbi:MAG TPA: XdhC family protein [Acidiferrobacterales bacterium]|nr:XdhC family protein [Acidiferrobacterales bacterium]
MDSADREVLTTAADWLDAGHGVYLVTVARTWGSSPRPPGSLLAVRADDARFVGSVSGGCVEDDLSARLAAQGASLALPRIESYGVTPEQNHRFGLPCGGHLDLVVEQLASSEPLRAILRAMDARRLTARRVCLATGEASLHTAERDAAFRFDGENLIKVFGPAWRLLLIGAGQLSRFVAQMAQALDYEVIVCDPREEYAAQWRLPGAALDTRSPDDAVSAFVRDARSAVLALTHEPKLDDLALMEALVSPAFYVGALGSHANNARRRARLAQLELAPSAIEKLHGPVGLPIGSRTPAEIAVAILAELTAVRNGITLHRSNEPERADTPMLDAEVTTCAELPASC